MESVVHLVCPKCETIVRVPHERMDDAARCPRCKASVFPEHPIELKSSNFDRHLSRNDLPMVVDFWAPWCAPCRMMAPHFEAVARQLQREARFAKVNSDEEPALSARFQIRGIPTLIAFRSGRELARQSGAMDRATLLGWVRGAIAAA